MHGVWCGRSTRIQQNHEWHRELRIEFVEGDPERVALATDTWNRVPGGPMGETGYVISSLLIPMPRSGGQGAAPAARMHFKAVSAHDNVGGYGLSLESGGVVIRHGDHAYPMSQDCRGFWTPGGSEPDASEAS